MTENTTGGARKFLTRILATGALLGIYCMGTLAMTGALMGDNRHQFCAGLRSSLDAAADATDVVTVARLPRATAADARRWVCRHNGYTSGRRCFLGLVTGPTTSVDRI